MTAAKRERLCGPIRVATEREPGFHGALVAHHGARRTTQLEVSVQAAVPGLPGVGAIAFVLSRNTVDRPR